MYLNKALIIGNLTRDPESKALPDGRSVASFSLATNRVWNDKDGNKNEVTDFHDVVVFGKQADSVAQYLKKGSQALVEGRLQTRSWEKDGQKHYRTEIVADYVRFGRKASPSADTPTAANGETVPENINPEDIPF